MIYTCTTNPSLDYYIFLNELSLGNDNRSISEEYEAGGKGVNVSIVLNNFEIPSVCLGFLGGFIKDYYLEFINKYPNIQPLFTSIKDNSRINIKIKDNKNKTDINAKGPKISESEFNIFKSRMNNIYTNDIFVLSGNIEKEIMDDMIEIVHQLSDEKVKVILDCDNQIIERCLDTKIFAIKLNEHNLDNNDLFTYSKKLIDNKVEYVLYSNENTSSYIFTDKLSLKCDNNPESLMNATGSSDSMLAGFIYGIIRAADTYESFKYANAAALATSMSNDLASKDVIEKIFNTIEVKQI